MCAFYPGQMSEDVLPLERRGRELSRMAAADGMVLLHNNGALPLRAGARLALFGLGARHTIKGGTGSGDVNSRDVVSVEEGLRAQGFTIVNSRYLDEYDRLYTAARQQWIDGIYAAAGPEKDPEKLYMAHVSMLCQAVDLPITAQDTAEAEALVYVISRSSGEAADRKFAPGDYLLSDLESRELEALSQAGKPLIVLLNVGGIIDLSFMDTLPVSALLLMGQAGCDSGHAAADVLSSRVNPAGRLTDSWAYQYADYPSSAHFSHRDGNLHEEFYTDGIYVGYRYFDAFGVKPRYPFGYGLSYTAFRQEAESVAAAEGRVTVQVRVTNIGSLPGRQVAQLYAACPQKEQAKEFKRLVSFGKTSLLAPGESETLTLRFPIESLASYRTGKAAWVLEQGDYILLLGESAEAYAPIARLALQGTRMIGQLENVCELLDSLKEITSPAERRAAWEAARERMAESLPAIPMDSAVRPVTPAAPDIDAALLAQAKFLLASLTEEEKVRLCVGMPSAWATDAIGESGNAVPGAAGETLRIPEKGVPAMVLADGPAGLRLQKRYETNPDTGAIYRMTRFEGLANRFFGHMETHAGAESHWQFATAIPVGTLLAQSFDPALLETVGAQIAEEMRFFGVAVWLAPGLNIHRNPLCGRNFEYFSEDPLISGLMAAAITRGVQRRHTGVTIKHYACNNQEDNRMGVNAVVSERALRELYLKGFEIAVKTAQPLSIMTSYNKVNGVHTANSRDLCTVVARQEWGFGGFIMTDWTTTNGGHGSSAAKCIRAGNDVVMPGRESDRREIADALDGLNDQRLSREQLDQCALRILYAALWTRQE